MTRFFRLAAMAVGALLLLLAATWLVLWLWVRTDDFHRRVEAQATQALGVPVRLGRIGIDAWPVPAVAVQTVELRTVPVLSAERVELRAAFGPLLRGRVELGALLVRQAHLSQEGVAQLLAARQKLARQQAPQAPGAASAETGPPLPRRIVLEGVSWRSAAGHDTRVDADTQLGDDGLPDTLRATVQAGYFKGADLRITRAQPLRWKTELHIAGGQIVGTLGFAAPPLAPFETMVVMDGQFETRDVALQALGQSVGRPLPMRGRLAASTTLQARAKGIANIAQSLQTNSRVTVHEAVVVGIDLRKAVGTVGLNRGGETALDTLTAQVRTQGQAVQLTDLVASSGVLRATGNVSVSAAQALSGRVAVDVAASALGKAVSVPLVVGGTVAAPSVTLSRAALLGAAIGTAVLPGAGTAAGARLGDQIGDKLKGLFGGK